MRKPDLQLSAISNGGLMTGDSANQTELRKAEATTRYLSIDFFRGLTVAFMIIVNSPGTLEHIYAPLNHSEWHGCTLADIVFPSFMLLMGISMWFSFGKYDRRWSPAAGRKILQRTILIFLIGLMLNKFPIFWINPGHWHVMGVLQRLAIDYGVASLLVLTLNRRSLVIVAAGILLIYWGILNWFAEPGADPYAMGTNVVLHFERWLFHAHHLQYSNGQIHFDPESVLNSLPGVVNIILGWFCGMMIARFPQDKITLIRNLLLTGVLCGLAGLAWNEVMPINKKLWTSSFVLYSGGVSIILLAASIWLVDMIRWRKGIDFFLTFGSNPLLAYVLSEALIQIFCAIQWHNKEGTFDEYSWIYIHYFKPYGNAEMSSLDFAIVFMLICWLICRRLYIRKIFIRI